MDAPGGTFLLTWVTYDRRPILRAPRVPAQLRSSVAEVKQEHPFEIRRAVILPDHIHLLWELPSGDADDPGGRVPHFRRRERSVTRVPHDVDACPQVSRGHGLLDAL
jgi:REP element-mobilizing transposase RayT